MKSRSKRQRNCSLGTFKSDRAAYVTTGVCINSTAHLISIAFHGFNIFSCPLFICHINPMRHAREVLQSPFYRWRCQHPGKVRWNCRAKTKLHCFPGVCGSGVISALLRLKYTSLWNSQVSWDHFGSLKSVMVGEITPWKLANTTNQGSPCHLLNIYQHTTENILIISHWC